MICNIFRSDTKDGVYLYLAESENIEELAPELLKLIGQYTFVMQLDLRTREKLALVDIEAVKQNLIEKGYFLQLPRDPVKDVLTYK